MIEKRSGTGVTNLTNLHASRSSVTSNMGTEIQQSGLCTSIGCVWQLNVTTASTQQPSFGAGSVINRKATALGPCPKDSPRLAWLWGRVRHQPLSYCTGTLPQNTGTGGPLVWLWGRVRHHHEATARGPCPKNQLTVAVWLGFGAGSTINH